MQFFRIEGQALVGTIRLSAASDAASWVLMIREGVLRTLSIGYGVPAWAETTDGKTGKHMKTARAFLDEIAAYDKAHPIGTTARLALALAPYTGQRRGDLVQFGKQHVRDGWLIVIQNKGLSRNPIRLNCRSSRPFGACVMPARQAILPSWSRRMGGLSQSTDSATFSANGATRPDCHIAACMACARPPLPTRGTRLHRMSDHVDNWPPDFQGSHPLYESRQSQDPGRKCPCKLTAERN